MDLNHNHRSDPTLIYRGQGEGGPVAKHANIHQSSSMPSQRSYAYRISEYRSPGPPAYPVRY